tara:strand:- start:1683 stop:2534 length:852 start_codon:yes stop_codon:yes gene_type:complete
MAETFETKINRTFMAGRDSPFYQPFLQMARQLDNNQPLNGEQLAEVQTKAQSQPNDFIGRRTMKIELIQNARLMLQKNDELIVVDEPMDMDDDGAGAMGNLNLGGDGGGGVGAGLFQQYKLDSNSINTYLPKHKHRNENINGGGLDLFGIKRRRLLKQSIANEKMLNKNRTIKGGGAPSVPLYDYDYILNNIGEKDVDYAGIVSSIFDDNDLHLDHTEMLYEDLLEAAGGEPVSQRLQTYLNSNPNNNEIPIVRGIKARIGRLRSRVFKKAREWQQPGGFGEI